MQRHTPFCKKISRGLDAHPSDLDEFYECRNLDQAIRSLGLNWRQIDGAVLIGVVEDGASRQGESVEVYRSLLRERVDQLL